MRLDPKPAPCYALGLAAGMHGDAAGRVGQILGGKYTLERVLGEGGMATVYAATHRNRNQVAIKVLHAEFSRDEDIRSRFLREGYVANSVGHPGAVTVLDDDVAEDGTAYLVMELLDGSSLQELADTLGGTLPLPTLLDVGEQLLDILGAAHAAGIVHRDIKPDNLYLERSGELKVLDFGIARLHETVATRAGTRTGVAMGTPGFMAPEQALGKTAEIDPRTDLWAAGATLFCLATGTLPHTGETAAELMVLAATEPARPVASLAPKLSPALATAIDRALQQERGRRWSSATEMKDQLLRARAETFGDTLPAASVALPQPVSVSPGAASVAESSATHPGGVGAKVSSSRKLALAAFAAAALGLIISVVGILSRPSVGEQVQPLPSAPVESVEHRRLPEVDGAAPKGLAAAPVEDKQPPTPAPPAEQTPAQQEHDLGTDDGPVAPRAGSRRSDGSRPSPKVHKSGRPRPKPAVRKASKLPDEECTRLLQQLSLASGSNAEQAARYAAQCTSR